MIYSVWDQGKSAFDYFETNERQASLNAPKPSHMVSRTLGSTVDQAAWPLPTGARPIGSGAHAVGRVASRNGGRALSGDLIDGSLVKAGLLLGSAYLLWKYVVKGRR